MAEKDLKSLRFKGSDDVYKVCDETARQAVDSLEDVVEGKQSKIDAQHKLSVDLVDGALKSSDLEGLASEEYVDGAIETVEAQIPDISNLATKSELEAVEQQIPDVSGLASETYVDNGLSTKQNTIDSDHKLSASLVDGALTSEDLDGLATEDYVDQAIADIDIPEDLEHKIDFLDENLRKEWTTTEDYLPYDSFTNATCTETFAAGGGSNTGSVYTSSTFCGWYGGVGHPQQVDWVEFNIVTRADMPVTKVWASIAVLTREIELEDYKFDDKNFPQNPRIGSFSQFVTGCRNVLIYDDAEHPLEGDNVNHTIRWELPEPFVNTEDYEVIIGYACNNCINGGYRRFKVNKHKGLYEPWVHYSTWSKDSMSTPITNVIGVENAKMNCTGSPYDDNTNTGDLYPRWSYPAYIRFGYTLTFDHEGIKTDSIIEDFTTNEDFTELVTDIAGDAIDDHDYQPVIEQTFEDMGLTEQLENAQAAADLVEPVTLIVPNNTRSTCDLVANESLTKQAQTFKYFDPASTFNGEMQVIGRIPSDVKIEGFRIPFCCRKYADDGDAMPTATKAKIRLFEADGYPGKIDPTQSGSSTSLYKNWKEVDGYNNTPVRSKVIDVNLTAVSKPNYADGGLFDFMFDEPYYNTNNKVLYLAVHLLGARFFRTSMGTSDTTDKRLGQWIAAKDGTEYEPLISWYFTPPTANPNGDPAPTKGWVNPLCFAYTIITTEPSHQASEMFNDWVDERTATSMAPMVEQGIEDYIDEHPSVVAVPPQYEVRLAKKYYAVQGDKIQLFYDGCIKGIYPSATANITVRCAKGAAYPRYWEYTPSADDVGTSTTLTLYVRDHQGKVISKGSTTIIVTAKPSFSSPTKYNMLGFGDSLTSSGTWFGEGMRRLVGTATEGVSGPASWKIPNLTLDSYGKKHNTVNTHVTYHEGYGGWTWGSFLTANNSGSTVNGIFVNLTTATEWDLNTVQHSVWVDQNNKNWKLEDFSNNNMRIKFDRGSGNTASQTDTPLPTQLTCSTLGLSLTASDITSVTWESGNPFYDNDTERVNFLAHASELGHEPADIVSVLLTWNGGGADWSETNGWTHQGKINTHINNATTLLRKIHDDLPNAKIIVMGIQLSSITGGNGANYGANGSYSDTYGTNYYAFDYDQALENLVTNEEFGQYCYYGDTKAQFDTADLMPTTSVAKNTRSSNTELRGTNGVHPSTAGYYAIGDAFFRCLCKVLNDTKADYEGNNA